jgi:hypothetical protein
MTRIAAAHFVDAVLVKGDNHCGDGAVGVDQITSQ